MNNLNLSLNFLSIILLSVALFFMNNQSNEQRLIQSELSSIKDFWLQRVITLDERIGKLDARLSYQFEELSNRLDKLEK